jgi:dimethylargininase
MAEAELTHIARAPIHTALAATQHAAYRAALAACGASIIDLPALDAHPDCAFVEDVALVFPEIAVLCRPGAPSRRAEPDAVRDALPTDRPLTIMHAPATIDGGDVLTIGRTIFAGLSSRTNAAAIEALAECLHPFGYRVTALPSPHALHLKTAVTALSERELLINPAWIDPALFTGLRCIEISPDEPFAANALPIGSTVIYPPAHRQTASRLERAGFDVLRVDIGEFAKAEAGITCLSIVIV